ncbi:MAG: hypothetical protein ACOYL5_08645 [Phototrophicaceae bacterium]
MIVNQPSTQHPINATQSLRGYTANFAFLACGKERSDQLGLDNGWSLSNRLSAKTSQDDFAGKYPVWLITNLNQSRMLSVGVISTV